MNAMRNVLMALAVVFLLMSVGGIVVADQTLGKFKTVLADKETFVVTENDQDRTFRLGAGAKVVINDREGALTDLRAGDPVAVTWQEREGSKVALMVSCRRP